MKVQVLWSPKLYSFRYVERERERERERKRKREKGRIELTTKLFLRDVVPGGKATFVLGM
jgi:hypothetical protein